MGVGRSGVLVLALATALMWPHVAADSPIPHPSTLHQHAVDFRLGEAAIQPGPHDPSGQAGSGGRAVAHSAGGIRVRAKRVTRRAPDARLYRTGVTTWEPTMGITQQGTIVVNAESDGSVPSVMSSRDGGKSWDVAFDGHPITADPYLWVDPDTSRIFANDYVPPCHLISISDDEGETWTTNRPTACGYNSDHQTIFGGPPPEGSMEPTEYQNVVYICSIGDGISIAAAGSVCSRSLDGGVTFTPTGTQPFVDDPTKTGDLGVPGLCSGSHGHGFVGPDGAVYLPRGWCGQPYVAISHDEGLTWTRVQVADLGMPCCGEVIGVDETLYSHEAGVVADALGNVYYAWVANDRLPYLAISRDGGTTWDEPMMIGPPGLKEALLPGITIGRAGRVAVHYMGSTNSPWNGTEMASDPADMTWNAYITMTVQALKDDPLFYSGTINAPAEPLRVGPCGPDPARCEWGDFFDVVVGVEGDPWAVAVDLCTDESCGGGLGEAIIGRLKGGPPLK
ncbi:MAG TPA: sialidase family protein [Actinomycetota bacterium]|nr:sialidase family protein [Actinomycetota bacterium]